MQGMNEYLYLLDNFACDNIYVRVIIDSDIVLWA